MAIKTRAELKSTRDFHHVLDSMLTRDTIVSEITAAAEVTLLRETHAGKLNLISAIASSNDNYVLPIPQVIGETYNLVWGAIVADADNIIIRSEDADGLTFTGMLLDFDTDATDASGYVMVKPGSDDDKLTITNPESFDITFTATTLTNYHVRGFAMSTDTASSFGDL